MKSLPRGWLPPVPVLLGVGLLLTGAAALAEEILWSRMLRRLLGSTTGAQAAVLAGLLSGMAAGSWLSGRAIRRAGPEDFRWAFRRWAFASLASGVAAVVLTVTGACLERLDSLPPPAALLPILLLFAAGLSWGAGFPLAAASLGARPRPRAVAALYGLNSVGGAAGAMAAPFLLVHLGERAVLAVAASVQIASAIGSLAALRWGALRHQPPPRSGAEESAPERDILVPPPPVPPASAPPAPVPPAGLPPRPARNHRDPAPAGRPPLSAPPAQWEAVAGSRRAPALVFLAGLAVIYWEMLWARILVLVVGSSLQSFSMAVGGVVLGIGLGSILFAGAPGGAVGRVFPLCLAGVLAAGYFAVPYLPDAYLLGARLLGGAGGWGPVAAGGLVLAACAPLGLLLPWAMAAAPLRAGPLAASNGAGAALGALLAGPVLAGRVGLEGSYLLGVALAAAVAGVAAGSRRARSPRRELVTAVLLLAVATVPLAGSRFRGWDMGRLLSGVYQWPRDYLLHRSPAAAGREMLFLAEGREVIVSVESDGSTVFVKGNGKVEGTVPFDPRRPSLANLPTPILLGALPCLLVPGGRAAVLGLGGGTTLGTAHRGGLESIDCLEIEPAFRQALADPRTVSYFREFLGGALSSPRVRWWWGDARALLGSGLSASRWDVFVSQPSEPWISASAPLFTREFFARAAGRLTPQGIFVQWVQLYKLPLDALEVLVRTFRSVQERVFVIRPPGTGELILLGARRPVDLEALLAEAARLESSAPGLLGAAGLEEPVDLLAAFLLGPEGVDGWLGSPADAPLNTDDRGLLEVRAPALLHEEEDLASTNLRALRLRGGSDPISRYLPPALRSAPALRRLAARNLRLGDFWEARAILEGDASAEAESLRAEAEREIAAQGAEVSGKR